MTTEEKNSALYEKMSAEQDAFREQLKSLPPEEILSHAYEYTVREDIVMAMEEAELSDAQADVLLAMEKPLSAVYNEFSNKETSYMEIVADSIAGRANAELRIAQERREALRNLPLYPYPGSYAREHDELEQYRESRKANVDCRDAIDKAISENYHDNSLDSRTAIKQVVDEFGYERMLHICACTVRDKEWDGRISQDNIRWAHTFPIFEDNDGFGFNRRVDYLVDRSHPGLFDLFVKAARREYLLTQPLAPEEIVKEAKRIHAALTEATKPNSPSGTHYMTRVSQDFMLRAGTKDMAALLRFLPFKGMTLSKLTGDEGSREGMYALLPEDADRSKPFREPRASVLEKLKKPPVKNSPKHSANLRKEAER